MRHAAANAGPFVRRAGSGHDAVICLHSNASNSGQWRGLMDRLAPRFRVFAIDSYGAGKTQDWPSDRVIQLSDEVDLIEPVLREAGSRVFLVGHSYGAAIALKTALRRPGQIRGMALFEPTFFSVLDEEGGPPNDADGIRHTAAAAGERLDAGDREGAAQVFIDYWMGVGSWDRMPAERKAGIAASAVNVRRWAHALFTEPARLRELAALDIPVLYLVGALSTASSLGVARRLCASLPNVQRLDLPGVGHMAPVTHAERVDSEIEMFLNRLSRRSAPH